MLPEDMEILVERQNFIVPPSKKKKSEWEAEIDIEKREKFQ